MKPNNTRNVQKELQELLGAKVVSKTYSPTLWNDNDERIIKGLAFFGEGSYVWKKAEKYNPKCAMKARKLLRSGWRPVNTEMPKLNKYDYEKPF